MADVKVDPLKSGAFRMIKTVDFDWFRKKYMPWVVGISGENIPDKVIWYTFKIMSRVRCF